MSFNSMVTDVTSAIAKFWLQAAKDFNEANNLSKKGTFTADQLARGMVTSAANVVDIWMKVVQTPPAPLVPTLFFSEAKGNFVGQALTVRASLNLAVPPGAVAKSSDLGQLGGTKKLPAGEVTVVHTDTEVDITLQLSATPDAGVYQGVAFYDIAPATVIAHIVVHAT